MKKQKRIDAGKQQKYWKNKYEEEAINVDEDYHNDLSSIINLVNTNDMPSDLTCLWDNQQKVLKANGKVRFRWHPK